LARPRRRDWGPLLARGSLRLSPEPSRVAFGDVSLPVLSHPIPRGFPVSGSVNLSMGNTIVSFDAVLAELPHSGAGVCAVVRPGPESARRRVRGHASHRTAPARVPHGPARPGQVSFLV